MKLPLHSAGCARSDPSGHFFGFLLAAVGPRIGQALGLWGKKTTALLYGLSIGRDVGKFVQGLTDSAVIGGLAGGFAGTLVQSRGNLEAAVKGGISGALFGWAGGFEGNTIYAAHAVAGCISAVISDGRCGQGATAAVFGKYVTVHSSTWGGKNPSVAWIIARFVAAVVAGGVGSKISGGEFKSGATTAAYGFMFNYLMHITGGMREGTNPFGHTALAVEGAGVYSYGNGTLLGSDPLAYIKDQSLVRDQLITIIPTTPQQDAVAIEYFGTKPGMNSVGILDNCAVRTSEALMVSGVPVSGSVFPGGLARQTSTLPGVQNFYITKGGAIPQALVDIVRQRFTPPSVP